MPILSPDDKLINRLALPLNQWSTELPDPASAASTFTELAVEANKERFALDQMANSADGYQKISGAVMQRVGAPQGDGILSNDLFDGLMGYLQLENPALELMKGLPAGLPMEELAGKLVEKIAEILLDALSDVLAPLIQTIGAIPLYGWLIEAVWDVAIGIVKIVRLVKESNAPDPEREYEAASFSPSADRDVAALIGSQMSGGANWTNIYMPPGIGANEAWYGSNFFGEKLTNGIGYRITSAGHHEGWIGAVPGNTKIDLGFEILDVGGSRGLGDLFPTSRNLTIGIWDQINNMASPSMYTVDAIRCMKYWEGHLRELIEQMFSGSYQQKALGKYPGVASFIDGIGAEYFGWSTYDQCARAVYKWRHHEYDGDQTAYLRDLGVSRYTGGSPAAAMRRLYQAQYAGLNTTLCAYTDAKFSGAFLGNTYLQPETQALIDRWDTNRKLLLGHRERCNVDVRSIPDPLYKYAMEQAQETCLPEHEGSIALPDPRRRRSPLGRKLRGLMGNADAPPVDQSPGGRRTFKPGDLVGQSGADGAGALVLGMGGVAAIIAIMLRRK